MGDDENETDDDESIVVEVSGCSDCPLVSTMGPCCDHWCDCAAPGTHVRIVSREDEERPPRCPLDMFGGVIVRPKP